ncbi:MAG: transposase [Alphaproteobacteria bacterium]
MARKRHSDEDIWNLLREIELKLSAGSDVASACRGVGISEATYYNWCKRFGGMGRSQLSELRSLKKENARLKKIVAELELDKLILRHGTPEYNLFDNGPEFAAQAMQDWLVKVGIKPIRIYPGSPLENGYNERFNGTLRHEVLNAERFTKTKQA